MKFYKAMLYNTVLLVPEFSFGQFSPIYLFFGRKAHVVNERECLELEWIAKMPLKSWPSGEWDRRRIA